MDERGIQNFCGCSYNRKSQGSAILGIVFLAFAISFMVFSHASSFDVFNVSVYNKTNFLGVPVVVNVAGPNSTNFTLDYSTNQSVVLSQFAATDSLGQFQSSPNFSVPGRYTVNLSKDNFSSIVSTWFDVVISNITENVSFQNIVLNATNVLVEETEETKNETVINNIDINNTDVSSTDANNTTSTGTADLFIIKDAKGKNVKAEIIIKDAGATQKGIMVLSSSVVSDRQLVEVIPETGPVKKIEFFDINTSVISELGLDDVPETGRIGVAEIYAINPEMLDFTEANVTVVAKGSELLKCVDWNFENRECFGEWVKLMDLVPGEEYTFTITPIDPAFSETESLYATANNNARKIVRDSSGNLYFVYVKEYLVNYHIYVSKSTDDGYTWSDMGGEPIESVGAYDQEMPSMAIDGNDNLHVVWHGMDAGSNIENKVKYVNYTGSSWSNWINISDISGYIQESPSIVVDSSSNLHVVWEGKDVANVDKQIKYINRTASGWSLWTNIDIISEHDQLNPCAVFDSSENLHVFWYGKDAASFLDSQIKYINKTASGWSSWIDIQLITGYTQAYVSAAVDESDNLHIAWSGKDSGSAIKDQIKYSNRTVSGWSTWVNVYPDSAIIQASPSIVIDSNNTARVLWMNNILVSMSVLDGSWLTYPIVSAGSSRYPTIKWSQFFNNNPVIGNVIDFGWTYGTLSPYKITYSYQ